MAMDERELRARILFLMIAAPLAMALAFFVPAGTLDYWQAWLYMAVLLVPMFFVVAYFLMKDPAFLERRLRTKEKEAAQGLVVKASLVIGTVAFILPGLDHRFGWSDVPAWASLAADGIVLLGYLLIFLTFRENSYAGRTITVEKGQKVVSTGPYSVVRHPMYLGSMALYLATPIALGSLVSVPAFILFIPVLVLRILNEEQVLRRDLPGYAEYCGRTRHRLLPGVW
jgi:protein-S-isoprenylcysteine O-methyltransferase Ste14